MISWLSCLWAKTPTDETAATYHPLLLHMLDAAACARALLKREPQSTSRMLAAALMMDPDELPSLLSFLVACHDIGKAAPGFQLKWPPFNRMAAAEGITIPHHPDTSFNHAFLSQSVLETELPSLGWDPGRARLLSYAVGYHHGVRPSFSTILELESNRGAIGDKSWSEARCDILRLLAGFFKVKPPTSEYPRDPAGEDFAMLAGFITISDWIASDTRMFPYGTADDCLDLATWYKIRCKLAAAALDRIGWNVKSPLTEMPLSFTDVFSKYSPRPLQSAMAEATLATETPSVFVIEAPMGEGKTEAALFSYLVLQARLGHRGLYMAMPTRATGNAMYDRVREFLDGLKLDRPIDLQLVHGAAVRQKPEGDVRAFTANGESHPSSAPAADIEASEWFGSRKKALLSETGVGTIDQALMSVLSVRHNYLRMWGLANKVVVFDEVHAYDAYTGTLLLELIRWLHYLNSSVVILSATLPDKFRSELASVTGSDKLATTLPQAKAEYPRITVMDRHGMKESGFPYDETLSREIAIIGASVDADAPRLIIESQLENSGMAAVIANTVDRAQAVYRAFGPGDAIRKDGETVGKLLPDGTEIYLFHARFPSDSRRVREGNALDLFFSKNETRQGRKVIVATQVIEQSLDLDFDLMITDLAPVDLLLQRAGRLWRKPRNARPTEKPLLYVAGLDERLFDFGRPLWWSAVYREDILIKTWALLRTRTAIRMPADIDLLVQAAYGEDITMLGDISEAERQRYERAEQESQGTVSAMRCAARSTAIGHPDDGSWEDPSRLCLLEEASPEVNRMLVAKTRSSDSSMTAVLIRPDSISSLTEVKDSQTLKDLIGRSIGISRKSVISALGSAGVPEAWKKEPVLRFCYPMLLDDDGRWQMDRNVRLDDELGLVYGQEV